ncbi:hypothetical protein PTSG_12597 [Salpingoeca rosetta]|uniref:Uncharacterized protein n=1 Tax=Salpingoeca rosetta (strain ATCC 50818 / BSB-021) TaxID=946362 RepID=F2UGY7_SALR5|nr:uncharacterized protein PTSG_12597 [Salpingoeca rosetta]EGD76386.1 hypothetical protein PTSG_12597 [Salpingoeca rosetta]|eukprot:XP_004991301.1 hypothetical protein PTSG_12597 [Salpingoeca rosetta]
MASTAAKKEEEQEKKEVEKKKVLVEQEEEEKVLAEPCPGGARPDPAHRHGANVDKREEKNKATNKEKNNSNGSRAPTKGSR